MEFIWYPEVLMIDSEIDLTKLSGTMRPASEKVLNQKSNCDNKTLANTHSRNGAGLPKRTATHRKQKYLSV